MQAIVQYRSQYGTEVVYPMNDVATRFADISGHRTLTKPVIEHMKALGVSFDVVQEIRSV